LQFAAIQSRFGKELFFQLKDRLRYSALPLNPAGKLCSRLARGRAALQLTQISRTDSILSTLAPLAVRRLTYPIRAIRSWQARHFLSNLNLFLRLSKPIKTAEALQLASDGRTLDRVAAARRLSICIKLLRLAQLVASSYRSLAAVAGQLVSSDQNR
jgi:hypothetical protein